MGLGNLSGVVPAMVCLVLASAALAQPTPAAAGGSSETLTPEEQRERDARKDCKVQICATLYNRHPGSGPITCTIPKSWRKEQLSKLTQKAKVSWPWGAVRCSVDLRLDREALIKAMTSDRYEMALEPHQVACEVERGADGSAAIRFLLAPKVTFEKGKAVKAVLNWGKIEAPTLVKGAMWTATATDNSFNVLQSTVVDDINDFVTAKCMEVKDEWAGK
jgi:hypothetical protein